MGSLLPSTLKLSALKLIAHKCGIPTSGTKPILASRILTELQSSSSSPSKFPPTNSSNAFDGASAGVKASKKTNAKVDTPAESNDHGHAQTRRILSIDMGIRNLAFCVFDVPPPSANSPSTAPSLIAWRRLNLIPSSPTTSALDDPLPPSLPATLWPNIPLDAPPTASPPASASAQKILAKEAASLLFTPPYLATLAHTLLTHTLLPYKPTHILIERQRFRTMGNANILEWTVRVNMLEAMLYAILHTLRSSQSWDGVVVPVNPGMVGSYWLDGSEGRGSVGGRIKGGETRKESISSAIETETETETETGADGKGKTRGKLGMRRGSKTRNAKAITKGLKIDLVGAILSSASSSSAPSSPTSVPHPPLLSGTDEARDTATAYLCRWQRLRKHETAEPKAKLQAAKAKAKSLTKSRKNAKQEAETSISAPKQKLGTVAEDLSKLDDLADCLLQGLAWVEWEWSREVLRKEGVRGLGLGGEGDVGGK